MRITAAMVKELRERTGAGMMECKKSLVECDGNIDSAIELMRKSGLAKAAKKAGRVAAEGIIVIRESAGTGRVVIAEINSETDFVAKADDFLEFTDAVAECILQNQPDDIEQLMQLPIGGHGSDTVEERRQQLILKIGENINVRRFDVVTTSDGVSGIYRHGNKIGVIVDLTGGTEELARDIAMHVAASRPVCVDEADVPPEQLAKEKEILTAQAADSGKPADIVEKMVQGRLKKYLCEITLVGQPFIKDPDKTIGKLLEESDASVKSFVRLEVGEGIEKKVDNFAEEVMAQARGT